MFVSYLTLIIKFVNKNPKEVNENFYVLNSPKLSGIPEGPGSKPGRFWRPKNELANDGVLEWSIDPFIPSICTSPASDATVSLLFESSPVLWAWSDCKSECYFVMGIRKEMKERRNFSVNFTQKCCEVNWKRIEILYLRWDCKCWSTF